MIPLNLDSHSSFGRNRVKIYIGLGLVVICFIYLLKESTILKSGREFVPIPPGSLSGHGFVRRLLDDQIHIASAGASLCNQQASRYADISMTLPTAPIIPGKDFQITLQCDSSIINSTSLCPPQYLVHFRGPTAHTLPPSRQLYTHDAENGTTVVVANIPLSGEYEIWIWGDTPNLYDCVENPEEGIPLGAVRGSGEVISVHEVGREGGLGMGIIDETRRCGWQDYLTTPKGRWVGLDFVRKEYQSEWWIQTHRSRFEYIYPSSNPPIPEYAYLPYQCKRPSLDYAASIKAVKNIKHIIYLGDSIFRTSFCGNLYPQLHDGRVDGDCTYADGESEYHFSPKTFTYPVPDERGHVRFSHRFITNWVGDSIDGFKTLLDYPEPITHIVTNLGMWFAGYQEADYQEQVYNHLENVYNIFGSEARYLWIDTASVSPPVLCYWEMRRTWLRRHADYARIAISEFLHRHPDVKMDIIDPFEMFDSRPESTSDGRHWVRENGSPPMDIRPRTGAADDALWEMVWDMWKVQYEREVSEQETT